MPRLVYAAIVILLVSACGSTAQSPDDGPATATPTVATTAASPSGEATPTTAPSPTPEPSEPEEPRELTGTWRTTLGGQALSLSITDTTYRIVRGSNVGSGSVAVTGERIEFFDSDLCTGTGVYRWAITDGALTFFPESEPCPGRAEALLVRYTDYTPRDG